MRVDVLTNDGSPLGVTSKSIWGDDHRVGVGGSELALLTMCEEWTKAGHELVLYNDPFEPGASIFEQRKRSDFHPTDKRDVLIVFRSPNPKAIVANGLKVWWSTDQYTINDFKKFAPYMDKIVVISDFHNTYFKSQYQINNAITIDLPVRLQDYDNCHVEKVTNRIIFTSVPDRGLQNLFNMWGFLTQNVKDISLVITSDYRLWGVGANNQHHIQGWFNYNENVQFLGAISRQRLIEEQLKAQVHLYPCTYDELFCIAVAESQVAGAYPITSAYGSLPTTNMGTVIGGNPRDSEPRKRFIQETVALLSNPELLAISQRDVKRKALERFSPANILKQWDTKVFNKG